MVSLAVNEDEEEMIPPHSVPIPLNIEMEGANEEIEVLNDTVLKYKQEIDNKSKEVDELKKQISQLQDDDCKQDLKENNEKKATEELTQTQFIALYLLCLFFFIYFS